MVKLKGGWDPQNNPRHNANNYRYRQPKTGGDLRPMFTPVNNNFEEFDSRKMYMNPDYHGEYTKYIIETIK